MCTCRNLVILPAILAALGTLHAPAAGEDPFAEAVPFAGAKRLDKSLVLRTDNADGTVDFDLRGAFAAGADKVRIQSRNFPVEEYRGRDFAIVGEWSCASGKPAMLESRPSGLRENGKYWSKPDGPRALGPERRHNQGCAGSNDNCGSSNCRSSTRKAAAGSLSNHGVWLA